MVSANVVEMRGIVKRFGAVTANAGIDFDLARGEVHALLGENGAGKSTLMKILYGLYTPDGGGIRVGGQAEQVTSPAAALALGIGLVSQHFSLVANLTVAENVALGNTPGIRFNERTATAAVRGTAERFQLEVDPAVRVRNLSVGEQQRVEILKALHRQCRVLILDEPTAVLTPQESAALFDVIRRLVEQGLSVVFISHKLDEVLAVSDRVTVLRDGRVVGRSTSREASHASLARLMVSREMFGTPTPGRSPNEMRVGRGESSFHPTSAITQANVTGEGGLLRLEDIHVRDNRRLPALRGLTLAVGSGEILGVAGVAGNGQRELGEVLAGLRHPIHGHIYVGDKEITRATPAEISRCGVGRIPEDRLTAVVAELTVAENLALEHLGEFTRQLPFSRRGSSAGKRGRGVRQLDRQSMRRRAEELIAEYAIKASPGDRARTLSGGNLQKLVLARVLSRRPQVVVAAEPTRGLDLGATDYVRARLLEARARGAAVLLISEDLDEVLTLSDRIAVIYEGKLTGVLNASEATPEQIGLLMTGRTVTNDREYSENKK